MNWRVRSRVETRGRFRQTVAADQLVEITCCEPLLRIYEGCGRAYLGEVEGANIIKIHRRSGKLSYLNYPDFETNPHPGGRG